MRWIPVTSNMQQMEICNPVFIKEQISRLANFWAKQIFEIGPRCPPKSAGWVNGVLFIETRERDWIDFS